jgi:hypothetical protein
VGLGLDANPTNYMVFGGARLIFLESIVFEECEVGEDGEISLTKMDRDCDLKDRVQVQMDKLDLEMVEQAVKQITGREPKPSLEEGFVNYDFIDDGDWDVLVLSWPSLENSTRRKKVLIDQHEDLALINGGGPKHL